jgi:hypothetical protein
MKTPARSFGEARRRPRRRASRRALLQLLVALRRSLESLLHSAPGLTLLSSIARAAAELARGPPEVGLEDLPDVHAARHAERVEHDVDRRAVGQVRHVLLGQDARDDALVAVAAGHLVADLELALDGDVDLHHLDDARRQLVALREALDLLAEVLSRLRTRSSSSAASLDAARAASSSRGSRPSTCAGPRRGPPRRRSAPLARAPCPCRRRACPSSVLPRDLA